MLGLISSGDLEATWSEKSLRKIFYKYPQGKFPLMGLLSLLDSEEVDKSKFSWWEKRHQFAQGTTATSGSLGSGGAGPFTDSTVTTSAAAAGFTWTAGTTYGVFVVDATQFRIDDVIWIRRVPNGAGSDYLEVKGVVVNVNTGSNYILVRASETVASVSNDTDANSIDVFVIGRASAENDRSRDGGYTLPLEVENYTQIFRQAFSFSRNALKEGARFDRTGVYKDRAKEEMLRVVEAMEMALYWGVRRVDNVVNQNSETVQIRQMGGILWYLKQWELGTTGNNAAFTYRPNGSDITSSDWTTTEDKRIIKVNGTLSVDAFEELTRRAFEVTSDSGFEKLVVCGNGYLNMFQKYVDAKHIKTTSLKTKDESYGITLTQWDSPWGTLYFKTHPLFQRSAFRYSAFYLDVGNLSWHDFQDSELTLLRNRQNNDTDGRKDEWLGEGGLCLKFPETHMYVEGVTGLSL